MPIIVDRLVLACAEFLVAVYGETDAMRIATGRFNSYAAATDLTRCAVWQQIMAALWELRRQARMDGEPLH